VWLHENDEIPCDLVLIGTSDPQGICYVEVNDFFLEHTGELRIIILRRKKGV
jgi:phospholipid-translocating ATPase